MIGSIFQPRTIDRLSTVTPPWLPDQILGALAAAESGDMGQQAELAECIRERDGATAGFIQSRCLAPAGLKWSIDPRGDSPLAQDIAEMVRDEIKAIPNFPIAFRHMQDAIWVGLSALWIDWQLGGRHPKSRYRINGLHHINPKRYRFDWQAEKFLILPDAPSPEIATNAHFFGPTRSPFAVGAFGVGVEPAPWKVLIHQTRIRSGHPAKVGVMRICALYFLLRNFALKDFSTYVDVYGMPLRIGKYPEGASDADKAALSEAITRLGTDGAAIVSKLVEVEYLKAQGGGASGTEPFTALLRECERQIQLAICGQDQTNTHNSAGGRTQVAEGGAPIRQDLLEADCVDSMATLTGQLCYPIVASSEYGIKAADDLCPKFRLHYEPEDDYVSMAQVDEILHTKLGLKTTQGQLAKRYGRELPEGVDAAEIIEFNIHQPPPSPFGGLPPADDEVPESEVAPPLPFGKKPAKVPSAAKKALDVELDMNPHVTDEYRAAVRNEVLPEVPA
jgi:phage gp29-like protein